jgi:hypothetical protein
VRIAPAFLTMAVAWSAMGQEKRPTFEVASVKRSAGDGFPDVKPRRSGSRVTMHNIRVATAIIYAYHLTGGALTTSYQLAGNLRMPDGWEEELGLKLKRSKGPVAVLGLNPKTETAS